MSEEATFNSEVKGGHQPALKVGNMRVARGRTSSGNEKEKISSEELQQQEEEFGTELVASNDQKKSVVIAGAILKEDMAYTAEAIKSFHDKPCASIEKSHAPLHHHIQQPRR